MASDVQILISAQDRATDAINGVITRLETMTTTMDSTASSTDAMAEKMDRASGSIMNLGAGLGNLAKFAINSIYFTAMGAAIQTMTDAVKDAIDTMVGFNAKQEQTAIGFETIIGSMAAAKTMMADLQTLADESHFQYKDLTNAAGVLLGFGVAAKNVIPDLTTIGNVVAGLGLSVDGMNHVVLAIGKMGLESHASMKEIRELNSWHINAQKYLQQELGLTANQITHLKDTGVTGAQAMKAILDGMAKDPMFANMMEKQAKTLIGVWATLKDQAVTIFSSIGQLIEQPISNAIHKIVEQTTQLARTLRTAGGAGLLEANPQKKEGEGASLRDTKETPTISPEWQVSLAKAYNALSAFWDKVEMVFTSIKQLISDSMGGTGTFDTFIEVLTKAGSVALIAVNTFVKMADVIVKLTKQTVEFVNGNKDLKMAVEGVAAAVLAYNVITGISAVVTSAWLAATKLLGPAIWFVTTAIAEQGVVQGLVFSAKAGLQYASLARYALVAASAIGVLVFAYQEFESGNRALGLAIAGVTVALTIYSSRAAISAAWTGVCAVATAAYEGVVALVRGTVIGFALVMGTLNMVMEGYNIITVTSAICTGIVDGIIAVCTGTVALAEGAWVAVTAAIAGFSLANTVAAVATAVCDGVITLVTGTLGIMAVAWDAVTTALTLFTTVEGLTTVVTTVLGAVMAVIESPILLVVAAIGAAIAVGYELYANWDMICSTASNLWTGLCNSVTGIMASLGNWFQTYLPGVYNMVTGAFTSIANAVSDIWDRMAKAVSETFSSLFNWIVAKLGPIGTALQGLGSALGAGISDAWTTVTAKVSSSSAGLMDTFKKMTGLGVATDQGRADIAAHTPWAMDDDGSGGKEKKGRKGPKDNSEQKYEQGFKQMEMLYDSLEEKLQAIIGTKPEQEYAKIRKEVDKAQQEIDKAASEGVDTSDQQAILDLYAKKAPEKVAEALERSRKEFDLQTDLMAAKAEKNKTQQADSAYNAAKKINDLEYQLTIGKLENEKEAWRKAGETEIAISNRVAAAVATADKVKIDADKKAVDDNLKNMEKEYAADIAYNNALVKLGKLSVQQAMNSNSAILSKQAADISKYIKGVGETTPEGKAATVDQASTVEQQDKIDASNLTKASTQVYKTIKQHTADYAKMYKECWDGIETSVSNHFTKLVTGQEKIGKALKSMILDISTDILNMYVKIALEKTIFSNTTGSGGSTSSNWFSKLFGGNRAGGGPVFGGNSYIVGEHGQEVFTPGSNGTITPNSAGSGGGTHVTYNIQTPNAESFKRSQSQLSADTLRAVNKGRKLT